MLNWPLALFWNYPPKLFSHLDSGVVIVQPADHHAKSNECIAFYMYNNMAVFIKNLKNMIQQIIIVNWDIHHGNGTQ